MSKVTENTQITFAQAIASADLCTLLSVAFDFPSAAFAEALLDGSFQADVSDCLQELSEGVSVPLTINGEDEVSALRQEYSRLYIGPGELRMIFPYEGAFRAVARNPEAKSAFFITPETKDVEHWMRRYGELPYSHTTEPVDSVPSELAFLAKLYTNLANALYQKKPSAEHVEAINDFRSQHIESWMPAFFKQTIQDTKLVLYGELGHLGLTALSASQACLQKKTQRTGR